MNAATHVVPIELSRKRALAGSRGGLRRARRLSKRRQREIALMGGMANRARLKAMAAQ